MQIVYTSNSAIVSDMYGRSQPRKSYACQKWPSFSTYTSNSIDDRRVHIVFSRFTGEFEPLPPIRNDGGEFC